MSGFRVGEILGYNSQEVNRNNNVRYNSQPIVTQPDDNIFATQKVAPVSFTSTPAMQTGSKYVSNPSLYETLNAMGNGEHSPVKYDEFTGKHLDIEG